MLRRLHQISEDRRLPQCPGGFEPVQSLNQNVAGAILPDQDRRFLAVGEHALGDLAHMLRLKRRATLGRHVNIVDRETLALEHASGRLARSASEALALRVANAEKPWIPAARRRHGSSGCQVRKKSTAHGAWMPIGRYQ